ncbi:multiheme c-type cytochrome [Sulfurovum sp.]|uniref:multiheme c-type cytochrome n=2 Tax=Sulfurovum sp. TaxID=1969726 RepID=UPI00261390AF|nr:multiheme c-type cytochrome [Sulfurovum sp.]
MQKFFFILLALTPALFAVSNQSKVCQKCHPAIYSEYYNSSHRKASVVNDPIHKACWNQYPKSAKGYTCAKCHSPTDKKVMKTGILTENDEIQREEPISCAFCHTIKEVDKGTLSNTNISTGKLKEFFTAEKSKKGTKTAHFETKSSWFGLIKTSQNSPYHKINYNNENYYNGNVCMGCHSHTDNNHGLDIVMLDALIDKNDKNTCISCHMPQVPGSKVTLHQSKTHAYHGIAGIHNMNKSMGKYIDFKVKQTADGFSIDVINHANHALFGQPYREGKLLVSLQRDGKTLPLKPFVFTRILAKDGKPAMPWNADATLKDTLIYAHKKIDYAQPLQKGDTLSITLGIQLLSKEGAKALNLEKESQTTRLRILKEETVHF